MAPDAADTSSCIFSALLTEVVMEVVIAVVLVVLVNVLEPEITTKLVLLDVIIKNKAKYHEVHVHYTLMKMMIMSKILYVCMYPDQSKKATYLSYFLVIVVDPQNWNYS